MYELKKKIGKVLTSKFVGTGPSSYEKRIYWAAVSQRLRNTGLGHYLATINPLKTKRRPLYLKTQSVPRCKHFQSCYKNQSVYAVSGTSRCLFSDKYKINKYSVGRAYSCCILNWWCIT